MIDIVYTNLEQLFKLLPMVVIIYIVFDFIGSFFFGKKWFMFPIEKIISVLWFKTSKLYEHTSSNLGITLLLTIAIIICSLITFIKMANRPLVNIQRSLYALKKVLLLLIIFIGMILILFLLYSQSCHSLLFIFH